MVLYILHIIFEQKLLKNSGNKVTTGFLDFLKALLLANFVIVAEIMIKNNEIQYISYMISTKILQSLRFSLRKLVVESALRPKGNFHL